MKTIVNCTVVGIKDYGVFCTCGEYSGLLHISEISEQYVENIADIFSIGDELTLSVLEVDEQYKKLRLSYKKNHPINERIRRHVPVKKGFNSLKKALSNWVDEEE